MKQHLIKNMFSLVFITAGALCVLVAGCAAPPLKGINPQGEKVYLGPVPIQNTEAYQAYLLEKSTEVAKQNYLFDRLRFATELEFYHNGSWYNSLEAYRGGMWLMRHRYQKGQDARTFIHKYVERAEDSGEFHLVKYPDGSIHIGSYVLYNELDLLEEATSNASSGT
jgi:hypothetical protein